MRQPNASADDTLTAYLNELDEAVYHAQHTQSSLPFKRGSFIVSARGEELEVNIKNITEEDAILIASELEARGVHVAVYGTLRCPYCHEQVPKQRYCVHCRHKLSEEPA